MSGRLWEISHFVSVFGSVNHSLFWPFCFFLLSFWIVCLTFMFKLVFRNTCIIYIWINNREPSLRGTQEESPSPWPSLRLLYLHHTEELSKQSLLLDWNKRFQLCKWNFPIVSILEKVFKSWSSSVKEQARRPEFTVEWKFYSPSSKLKEHAETQTVGINALYLGSKTAVSVPVST